MVTIPVAPVPIYGSFQPVTRFLNGLPWELCSLTLETTAVEPKAASEPKSDEKDAETPAAQETPAVSDEKETEPVSDEKAEELSVLPYAQQSVNTETYRALRDPFQTL